MKALVLCTAACLPLTTLAFDSPAAGAESNDPAARIKELETKVEQLQKELQALQFDRLNGRWRLVATQNETRKVRFRVGSVLDVQLSKLSLDRVPGTLEFLSDGSLKLVIDQDELICKPSIMGDYLKLELKDGKRYFFKKIPPTTTPQSS